jgi:hypothetical protein
MAVTLRRRRFTLDEYHRMGEVGILHEDDRVELIEGEIVEMTPIGRDHASVVARIQHVFAVRLGGRAIVWTQNPLLLAAQISEPQPDVILLDPRPDFYRSALPEPADVRLLVEVGRLLAALRPPDEDPAVRARRRHGGLAGQDRGEPRRHLSPSWCRRLRRGALTRAGRAVLAARPPRRRRHPRRSSRLTRRRRASRAAVTRISSRSRAKSPTCCAPAAASRS